MVTRNGPSARVSAGKRHLPYRGTLLTCRHKEPGRCRALCFSMPIIALQKNRSIVRFPHGQAGFSDEMPGSDSSDRERIAAVAAGDGAGRLHRYRAAPERRAAAAGRAFLGAAATAQPHAARGDTADIPAGGRIQHPGSVRRPRRCSSGGRYAGAKPRSGGIRGWEPGSVFVLENGQHWKVLKGEMKLRRPMQSPQIAVIPGIAGRGCCRWMKISPRHAFTRSSNHTIQ